MQAHNFVKKFRACEWLFMAEIWNLQLEERES
jgi:hypothetical protein